MWSSKSARGWPRLLISLKPMPPWLSKLDKLADDIEQAVMDEDLTAAAKPGEEGQQPRLKLSRQDQHAP